jgi:hypothetical protein
MLATYGVTIVQPKARQCEHPSSQSAINCAACSARIENEQDDNVLIDTGSIMKADLFSANDSIFPSEWLRQSRRRMGIFGEHKHQY